MVLVAASGKTITEIKRVTAFFYIILLQRQGCRHDAENVVKKIPSDSKTFLVKY